MSMIIKIIVVDNFVCINGKLDNNYVSEYFFAKVNIYNLFFFGEKIPNYFDRLCHYAMSLINALNKSQMMYS